MRVRKIEWSEQFEVGVLHLDEDHCKIVDLINEFGTTCCTEGAKVTLDSLFEVTKKHFENEERYLIENNLNYKIHKKEHRVILENLEKFIEFPRNFNDVTNCDESFKFVVNWFVEHSIGLDSSIKAYFDNRTLRF